MVFQNSRLKQRRQLTNLCLSIGLIIGIFFLLVNQSSSKWNEIQGGGGELIKQERTSCVPKEAFVQLTKDVLLSPLDPLVLDYVKCHHLSPSSQLPYNLVTKKGRNPSEIAGVLEKLFRNWKTPGFFIECGALDGEFFSNTLVLERDRNWTGLLVEAHPVVVSKLRSKNRKAWISDVCLAPENRVSELEFMEVEVEMEMEELANMGNTGRNRLKLPGIDTHGFTSIGTVPCFPLITLTTALNVTQVDLFSLDVEGADLKILKTLPFDERLTIDIFIVSNNLTPEGPQAMRIFMESKGYTTVVEEKDDLIFVRNGSDPWESVVDEFNLKV